MSISIVGVIVIIWSIKSFFLNYHSIDKMRWLSFKWMIVFSLFVNIGFIVQAGVTLRYFLYFEIIYVILSYIYYKKEHLKLNWKSVLGAYILVGFLLINVLNLLLNPDLPAIPDPEYDTLFLTGNIAMIKPQLTGSGIAGLVWMIIFVPVLLFSNDYFSNKIVVDKIIKFVKKSFEMYFLIAVFEFLLSNFVASDLFRSVVLTVFGTGTDQSFFDGTQNRNGYYCIITFFSEPSNIVTVLIYYLLNWKYGLLTVRDVLFHYISILVVVLSSSATAMATLPIALIISIKKLFVSRKKSDKVARLNRYLFILMIFLLFLLIYMYKDVIMLIWSYSEGKILAYLSGEKDNLYGGMDVSGGIRHLGNDLVLQVFLNSPLLGSGIGSVNAFNTIYAFLAMFGLIGTVAYTIFIRKVFFMNICKEKYFLLFIILLYFANAFHEYSFYVPAIIPVWILFNKHV